MAVSGRLILARIILLAFAAVSFVAWYYLFHPNGELYFTGTRYDAVITKIEEEVKNRNQPHIKNRTIHLAFKDQQGKSQSLIVTKNDYDFFYNLKEGNQVSLYLSESEPVKHYLPVLHWGISVVTFIFFIFLPLFFMIFGRIE